MIVKFYYEPRYLPNDRAIQGRIEGNLKEGVIIQNSLKGRGGNKVYFLSKIYNVRNYTIDAINKYSYSI